MVHQHALFRIRAGKRFTLQAAAGAVPKPQPHNISRPKKLKYSETLPSTLTAVNLPSLKTFKAQNQINMIMLPHICPRKDGYADQP